MMYGTIIAESSRMLMNFLPELVNLNFQNIKPLVDFQALIVGKEYDRPFLAQLWGYESYHAISRGVVTPQGRNIVILFITKEKQDTLTQYEDHIEQDILFWEGEAGHGTDQRVISKKDIIHVFYREIHHSSFVYEGRAELQGFKLYSDRPSKFTFLLVDKIVKQKDIVEEIKVSYEIADTEKDAIIKSRRGQGIYRTNCLELWKTCSVTGFTKANILVASHIKPWKVSSNPERIDHYNSLLLVPTLDRLFDKGYIGFEPNGKILVSEKIRLEDLDRIGLSNQLRLRQVPEETRNYLQYHCQYKFDLIKE